MEQKERAGPRAALTGGPVATPSLVLTGAQLWDLGPILSSLCFCGVHCLSPAVGPWVSRSICASID